MLPTQLLDIALHGERAVPRWLTRRDETWVRALSDILDACTGRPRREVEARLLTARLPGATWKQARAMTRLLLHERGTSIATGADPVGVRRVVFDTAAELAGRPRCEILALCAARLDMEAREIEGALYADLPGERRLATGDVAASPAELIERYNLALLQGLLFRAEVVRARLRDGVHPVLRFARLQRLLVEVHAPPEPGPAVELRLSGPLSLLRRTTKYGHAMARWLPALTRAPPWSLEAHCRLGEATTVVQANHADPIGTTHVLPRRFDSRLEERFFRDFARLVSPWTIHRDAAPVAVGTRIACPDFVLVDAERRLQVSVEIVGFWTPSYVESKLRLVASLPEGAGWLLCVDSDLAAGAEAGAWGPAVFTFRRRIDASAFLAHLERRVGSGRQGG